MAPVFDQAFRALLRELFVWRRDVRRFLRAPLDGEALERLLSAACLAPSVGLSQPWRFVVVDDPARRAAVIASFKACNRAALDQMSQDRAADYARLKLAGLEEAPCHIAAYCDEQTTLGGGLGRRTMPETARYSVVAAVCQMWLAARAEGIGMGWVSILDPAAVNAALDVPPHWRLIGYFCVGYPEHDDDTPELERSGWERRLSPEKFILRR
jgi:5,6-dimethylbenzimidazole synthase